MSDELGKLRPCPFCGEAESLLVQHMGGTTRKPAFRVVCDNCGASSGYSDRGDHINQWNVRAETDALNARIAELEARLKDPATVFVNMLRGEIEKPAFADMLSLYGDDVLAAEANRLREELKAEQHKNADALLRIAELEAQVRTAGAEALEKMGKRFDAKSSESEPGTAWWSYFRQAADECEAAARRLRGEGE